MPKERGLLLLLFPGFFFPPSLCYFEQILSWSLFLLVLLELANMKN